VVIRVNTAAGVSDRVVVDARAGGVIGGDAVGAQVEIVAGDLAGPTEVEDANGAVGEAIDVGNGVVGEAERAAGGGVDAAQENVLHGDVIDVEVVERKAERVIGDDAITRIDVGAVDADAAGEGGVVA